MFPLTRAKTSVDVDGHRVLIEVTKSTKSAAKAILAKPAETLNEWVKALLGSEWEVAVTYPVSKGRAKTETFPPTTAPVSQLDETLKNVCGVDPKVA